MSASPPKDTSTAGDPEPEEQSNTEKQTTGDMGDEQSRGEGPFNDFDVKEQDRWLPIANVARIMKNALPENAKIAKEAKECMQECVSEFISFITSEASEKCQQEKRKTVNGEDILFAMNSLGFENYAEALKIYLTKYRETTAQRGDQQGNQQGQAGGQPGQQQSPNAVQQAGMPGAGPFPVGEGGPSAMMTGDNPVAIDYGMPAGNGAQEEGY